MSSITALSISSNEFEFIFYEHSVIEILLKPRKNIENALEYFSNRLQYFSSETNLNGTFVENICKYMDGATKIYIQMKIFM